jgi:hypothetical protein
MVRKFFEAETGGRVVFLTEGEAAWMSRRRGRINPAAMCAMYLWTSPK